MHTYGMCQQINGHMPLTSDGINQAPFRHINTVTFNSQYKPQTKCTYYHSVIQLISGRFFIMDTTDYWLFARKYSIWNAAVTALKFRQQTLIYKCSTMLLNGFTQPSSAVSLPSI